MVNLNCKNCNKEFTRKHKWSKNSYCSKSCATTFNNTHPKEGRVFGQKPTKRICKQCSLPFFRKYKLGMSIKYCPQCSLQRKNRFAYDKNITISEYYNKESVKNKHPSWKAALIRNKNRIWNADLRLLPCQKCGYKQHVELCHIKPISSFQESATLSEVNSKENILVLCPNHHWEFDNGLLPLTDIPKRIL